MPDEDLVRKRLKKFREFQAFVAEHQEDQNRRDESLHSHVAKAMAVGRPCHLRSCVCVKLGLVDPYFFEGLVLGFKLFGVALASGRWETSPKL
eukprot:2523172-Amphidinium_carterae.1